MTAPLLVMLPHNPGDVVMGLAVVRRIKAARPDLPVDYVVAEECRDLVAGHPLLRRVLVIPRRALLAPWKAGDVASLLRTLEDFLAELGASRYGVSLNLFQERFGGLLHAFVDADRKVGLELRDGSRFQVGSRYLEHLFAVPVARAENGWHAVDIYVRAAKAALSASAENWPLPAETQPWLAPNHAPENWNHGERGYLAFHPGSAWPGKRWPEPHWAALTATCMRAGRDVVFTGAPEEKPVMEKILSLLPADLAEAVRGRGDYVGSTSLSEAAWIHGHARLSVSGDTVAMHLAAAGVTPVLTLFGPSNPVETGPYGHGHFILQTQLDLPADLAFAQAHGGLQALSPEAVSQFILTGAAPADTALWETAWDEARDMQVLRDRQGREHPHQKNSSALMAKLDADARAQSGDPFPAPAPTPLRGPRQDVRSRLAEADPSAPAALRALEAADRELARETDRDPIWEAYRIALNGLPLQDLREHVRLRRQRFAQALGEEAARDGVGKVSVIR